MREEGLIRMYKTIPEKGWKKEGIFDITVPWTDSGDQKPSIKVIQKTIHTVLSQAYDLMIIIFTIDYGIWVPARLNHPQQLPQVKTAVTTFDDNLGFSIEGGELFDRVIDDDFVLTEKAVAIFMRQICEGVDFIHSKNVLHLDMKVRRMSLVLSNPKVIVINTAYYVHNMCISNYIYLRLAHYITHLLL